VGRLISQAVAIAIQPQAIFSFIFVPPTKVDCSRVARVSLFSVFHLYLFYFFGSSVGTSNLVLFADGLLSSLSKHRHCVYPRLNQKNELQTSQVRGQLPFGRPQRSIAKRNGHSPLISITSIG